MMGKTHYASGIAAGLALGIAVGANPVAAMTYAITSGITVRIPDWDHPNSTDIRKLGFLGKIITTILRTLSKALTGKKHRGLTHSLIFGIIVSLPFALISPIYFIAALLGFIVALLGDYITEASLDMVFWPLKIPSIMPRRLRIKTGNHEKGENIIFNILLTIITIEMIWLIIILL